MPIDIGKKRVSGVDRGGLMTIKLIKKRIVKHPR